MLLYMNILPPTSSQWTQLRGHECNCDDLNHHQHILSSHAQAATQDDNNHSFFETIRALHFAFRNPSRATIPNAFRSSSLNKKMAASQTKKNSTTSSAPPSPDATSTGSLTSKTSWKYPSVSLLERPFDIILVLFYLTFILSTAFFDYHNVLAPALGVTVRDLIDRDVEKPLNWPPHSWTKTAFRIWGEQIDPIMITNPHFWQIMEWINVVFMTFGNAAMALAFTFGWRSFRTLGIVHATSLMYSLVVCIGVGMYGGEGYEGRFEHDDELGI